MAHMVTQLLLPCKYQLPKAADFPIDSFFCVRGAGSNAVFRGGEIEERKSVMQKSLFRFEKK